MIFQEWLQVNAQNHLEMENYDLVKLAQEYGTPLYVYDEEQIRQRCRAYLSTLKDCYPQGNGEIIFAGKAFLIGAMCCLLEEEDISLDVVSGGEFYTALKAGYPMERVYFHGNNKTPEELDMALEHGVGRIVVDSLMELELLNELAAAKGVVAEILLRVKPGVAPHTHNYIQTGQIDSKFGLGIDDGQAMEAVKQAIAFSHLSLRGIHCHIGSQIFDWEKPFRLVAQKMVGFLQEVKEVTGLELGELNTGGGLGIRHNSQDLFVKIEDFVRALAKAVQEECERLDFPLPRLMMEPGRSIIGEPGLTLYTVGTIKEITGVRTYVSVDGGMMDNLRPALYGAVYEGVLANRAGSPPEITVTVAGKACESGDILIKDLQIPRPQKGDILAVFSTGAYTFSMYSDYNRNLRPAVVFVRRGKAETVVSRETYEEKVQGEVIPPHLRKGKEGARE